MTDIHRVRELSALLEERERFFDGRLVEVYRSAGVSTPNFSLPRLKSVYAPAHGSASESAVSEKNEGVICRKGRNKKNSQLPFGHRRIKKKALTESSCDESEKNNSTLADDEYSVGTGFDENVGFPASINLHRNWRSVVSLSSHSKGAGRRNQEIQEQICCSNSRLQRASIHKEVLRTNALEKKLRTRRSSLPLQVAAKTWHRSDFGSVFNMEQNKLKQGKQSSGSLPPVRGDAPFSMSEVLRRTADFDATTSATGHNLRDELSMGITDFDGHGTAEGGNVRNTISGEATRKKRINKLLNGLQGSTLSMSTIHRREFSPTRSTLSDSFSDGVQSFLQKITTKQNFKQVNTSNVTIHESTPLQPPPLPLKHPQASYPAGPALHHVSPYHHFRQRPIQEEHDYCNDVRFLSLIDALVPCIESTSGRISY